MSVSMPLSFFDQLAITGRFVAAETTKRAVHAARAIVQEAPKHATQAHHWANHASKAIVAEAPKRISEAQSFAAAVAKVVVTEAPRGFVAARRIAGKAARVVITGAPKGAVAARRIAGETTSKVVAETPRHVVAVKAFAGGVVKVVVEESPKRFQAAKHFTTQTAKVVIAETPKHVAGAKNAVMEAVKKARAEQYGKALLGGASATAQRVPRVAVKGSVAFVTVSIGILAVAVSKILGSRFSAKDTAAGSAAAAPQEAIEMVAADGTSASQDTAADQHRQAVVQGANQIVNGATMAAEGLLGMLGRSLTPKQTAKPEKNHKE